MTAALLLTTGLKVADPTAITALATLRTRLGFGDILAGLSREELFLFEVEGREEAARAAVDGLVRNTNLFLNPNKHWHRLTTAGAEAAAPGAYLLVWTDGDGEDLREAVRRHTGAAGVAAVRRAWLWSFLPPSGAGAAELIARLGDGTDRRNSARGFLAHPAWQESRLYARRPGVYDVREALLRPAGGGAPDTP